MLKTSLQLLCIMTLFIISCKPDGNYDERAVESLDQMSETIGELNSCSYTISRLIKEFDETNELKNISKIHDVYMRGPDKMYVHSEGSDGSHSYWYNGSTLAYFSYDNNEYDEVEAPEGIVNAIDFLHDEYGIDFPAADFFYPTLTDDILDYFDELYFWGETVINDVAYIEIEARNESKRLVMLINSDTHLPFRLLINQISEEDGEEYDITFSNWQVEPNLPDILFEFDPPADAQEIDIATLN